jgi:hypothetical protein
MNLTRHARRTTALIALFAILFMQYAVGTYLCPVQAAPLSMHMAQAQPDMPGCTEMDMEQPSLCYAHSQADYQSLDKPASPPVPPFAPVILFATLIPADATPLYAEPGLDSTTLFHPTAPPLAIRHCCFRN